MGENEIREAHAQDFANELDLLLRARGVHFLIGAGVSMIAPTGLPSGMELLRSMLDVCVTEAEPRQHLAFVTKAERWERIVPELVFQRVQDAIGALPPEPYEAMFHAQPNRLHARLAEELDTGRASVSTTNFDRLISSQSRTELEPLHLHGHIGDLPQMTATIRQVGRGLPRELENQFIDRVRSASALVVFGYSGNDADIMSAVLAARPARVLWVARSRDDRAVENLSAYPELRADIVKVDLGELARIWGVTQVTNSPSSRASAEDRVNISLGRQYEIVVGCLQLLDEYEQSLGAAEEVLRLRGVSPELGGVLALASQALNKLDRQEEARQLAAEGLRVAEEDDQLRCRLLLQRGLAEIDMLPPEVDAAISDFARAADIARDLFEAGITDDPSLQGMALHNLGYAQTVSFLESGDEAPLRRAAEYYEQAIEVKRQAGDLRYLVTSCRNLAGVLLALGKDADAARPLSEFLTLADRYSLVWDRAYFDALCATLFQRAGRPAEAMARARVALDQFASMPAQASMVAQMRAILERGGELAKP